ncbi:NAD(P)-dependent oxidoreductase [Thermogladius sp. KZ2Tp1]|uniref:NAD(P)-dependent oxidoreductase n=1 Tax=unclassified Thermogladius TaxID=2647734 RepID=UPI003D12094C
MRVLIVGTGLMGSSIATCLARKGFKLLAYNRTASKAVELCEEIGCEAVETLEGASADYTLVSLFDDVANIEVLVSKRLYENVKTRFVVNTSTISPQTSLMISSLFRQHGVDYFEGTVFGSVDEARECRLLSMVAGESSKLGEVESLVSQYSSKTVYAGDIPAATALKLAVNNIALALPALIGESLEILEAYNVAVDKLIEVANASWLKSVFERYWPRIAEEKKARFTVAGAAKDFRIISGELKSRGYPGVVSSGVASFYSGLLSEMGSKDYPQASLGYLKKKKLPT